MSTFRAFQTGLMAGQQQAKAKREDDARQKAAEAFSAGNYEGAVGSLMGVGLMDDADAYERAGARKKEAEQTETYANAFKTGLGAGPSPNRKAGYQAVQGAAAERGDFATMQQLDQAIAGMDADQAKQFSDGMEFLGQTAMGLKQVPPEARGQAAMEILKNSPYGNEQIMAQISQAAADGRITDEELDNFAMQTISVADRVKAKMEAEKPYTLGPGQVRYGAGNQVVASQPPRAPSNGIQLEFGEDGNISGLSIGGTGTKGKEPAIVRGPNGQPVVSPGQQQLVANKDWQRIKSGEDQAALVRNSIAEAKKLVGPWTTGAGATLKDIPIFGQSTDAGSLDNLLKTIKTNLGFDKLDEMRANSPTGAALGNVTEKELSFLQAVRGSLEQAQKPADLIKVLEQVDKFVQTRDQRRKEAFAQDYPDLAEFAGFGKQATGEIKRINSDDEFDALPSGAVYVGPDGVKRKKP